jgi:glutathione S-transferase
MKLVGPWFSGYTRRVGVSLRLLDIPFEHLPFNAFLDKEAVGRFNPMVKVPALVLDDGEILFDSGAIVDYLDERVGPEKALIPASGPKRREVLRIVGIASAVYGKISQIYDESLRPEGLRSMNIRQSLLHQSVTGFSMLEAKTEHGWMVGDSLSQADIMTVIAFQSAARGQLADQTNSQTFPRLAALVDRAAALAPFSGTLA